MNDSAEQSPSSPPPVVCSERVLHYAILDDSVGVSTGHGLFFIDGKEIGRVPCLAICQGKNAPEFVLYYSASDWSMIGVATYDSIADAKRCAERIYPGSSARWIEAHFTEEDATRYMDKICVDQRCSFCGKRPDEILTSTVFEGDGNSRICSDCIAEFYSNLKEPPKTAN